MADFSNALARTRKALGQCLPSATCMDKGGDEEKERQANEQAAALDPTYYLARYNLAKNCECDEENLLQALEIIDALLAEGGQAKQDRVVECWRFPDQGLLRQCALAPH